jgi:hypothetical protein
MERGSVCVSIKNGRLLASGCSYTAYCWSTWADILGQEFSSYHQVGLSGTDNATVARSIIKHAQPTDTVVVMWTSFDRWSFYKDETWILPNKDRNNHWRHYVHMGSVTERTKDFVVNYYHPVERFQTTMDYIQLVDLHSKAVGYTAYHFAAFPLFHAETDVSDDPRLEEIYKNFQINNNYLLEVSLETFKQKNYNIRTNNRYTKGDTHPTPLCQWDYVENIIAPRLGIELNQSNKPRIVKEQDNLLQRGITIR